jgi:hypothetical protein
MPAAFEAAVESPALHLLQHFCFLTTALFFWWSLFNGAVVTRHGAALASLFTTVLHTSVLGALITVARLPWYRGVELADQQLAGVFVGSGRDALCWRGALDRRRPDARRGSAHPRLGASCPSHPCERIALGLVAALMVASVGYALRYFHAELPDPEGEAAAATGGSAPRGRQALLSYGCTACHRISGISEARGLVGPPLERF